jgi:hypothetical protein
MTKYLRWAGIAFVVFYLLSQPEGAARVVNNTIEGAMSGLGSLATFVNEVGK